MPERGEELGREGARGPLPVGDGDGRLWGDLDLPARVASYALRDARLGYIVGYISVLVSDELSEGETARAAEARWGGGWREKLEAARRKAGGGRSTEGE